MQGDPTEEYRETGANLRHYGNLRFAQITIFTAVSAGLFTLVYGESSRLPQDLAFCLKLGGAVVTACFYTMEKRTNDYWHAYNDRRKEIATELGFAAPEAPAHWLSGTTATKAFFFALGVFWAIAAALHTRTP